MTVYDWIKTACPAATGRGWAAPGRRLQRRVRRRDDRPVGAQPDLPARLPVEPGTSSIFGASDERYHIVGGNRELPEAIADALPAAASLGCRMTAIAPRTRRDGRGRRSTRGARRHRRPRDPGMSFAVLRRLNYKKAGFDALKQTAITQLGAGRTRSSSSSSTTGSGTRTARGESRTALLRRPGLPEQLGRHARAGRSDRHPRRLHRRRRRGSLGRRSRTRRGHEPAGDDVRAAVPLADRAGLPRHHRAVERQGDALDAGARPEPALLLLVLEARQYTASAATRASRQGNDPLRRRALLAGLPGLHGRRRVGGRPCGATRSSGISRSCRGRSPPSGSRR